MCPVSDFHSSPSPWSYRLDHILFPLPGYLYSIYPGVLLPSLGFLSVSIDVTTDLSHCLTLNHSRTSIETKRLDSILRSVLYAHLNGISLSVYGRPRNSFPRRGVDRTIDYSCVEDPGTCRSVLRHAYLLTQSRTVTYTMLTRASVIT